VRWWFGGGTRSECVSVKRSMELADRLMSIADGYTESEFVVAIGFVRVFFADKRGVEFGDSEVRKLLRSRN